MVVVWGCDDCGVGAVIIVNVGDSDCRARGFKDNHKCNETPFFLLHLASPHTDGTLGNCLYHHVLP